MSNDGGPVLGQHSARGTKFKRAVYFFSFKRRKTLHRRVPVMMLKRMLKSLKLEKLNTQTSHTRGCLRFRFFPGFLFTTLRGFRGFSDADESSFFTIPAKQRGPHEISLVRERFRGCFVTTSAYDAGAGRFPRTAETEPIG